MDFDVRGTLETILAEQISRLLMSGNANLQEVEDIQIALKKHRLMPEQIECDLAKELSDACSFKYDDIVQTSNRLDGYGWSVQHLQEHMERMLKQKLQQLSTILRTNGKTFLIQEHESINKSYRGNIN